MSTRHLAGNRLLSALIDAGIFRTGRRRIGGGGTKRHLLPLIGMKRDLQGTSSAPNPYPWNFARAFLLGLEGEVRRLEKIGTPYTFLEYDGEADEEELSLEQRSRARRTH